MNRHCVMTLSVLGGMLTASMLMAPAQPPDNTRRMEAQRILNQAVQIASAVKDQQRQIPILLSIAEMQAKAGDIAGAFKTIHDVPDWLEEKEVRSSTGKDRTLAEIAIAQAEAGDFAGGLKTLASSEDKNRGSVNEGASVGEFAQIQAKAGDFDGALRTVATIRNNTYENDEPYQEIRAKVKTLGLIAGAESIAGRSENVAKAREVARQTAGVLKEESSREWAQVSFAEAQIEAGDLPGAITTATALHDSEARSSTFHAILRAQAEKGDIAGALKTVSQVQKKQSRAEALLTIAMAQAKAGDRLGVSKSLEEARPLISSIEDDDNRMGAIVSIPLIQAQLGDVDTAMKTVETFVPYMRAITLDRIAEMKAKAGDVQAVRKTIQAMQKQADPPTLKDYLLCQGWLFLAGAQAKMGEKEGAAKTLQQALQRAVTEKDPYLKDNILNEICIIQMQAGDFAGALKTAEILKADSRGYALRAIAQAQAQAGDASGALRWMDTIIAPDLKVYALLGVVDGLLGPPTAMKGSS